MPVMWFSGAVISIACLAVNGLKHETHSSLPSHAAATRPRQRQTDNPTIHDSKVVKHHSPLQRRTDSMPKKHQASFNRPSTPQKRSTGPSDTRSTLDSNNSLSMVVMTPPKTAPNFLQEVFSGLAKELQACHITEHNCKTLDLQPECRPALQRQYANLSSAAPCGPAFLSCLSGSDASYFQFSKTPLVYAPIRNWNHLPGGGQHRPLLKVLHHRHPLDALVSEYNSWHSQQLPIEPILASEGAQTQSLSVDEYALQYVHKQIGHITNICEHLKHSNSGAGGTAVLSSYEDMVTDFKAWLLTILEPMMVNSTLPVRQRVASRAIGRFRFHRKSQHTLAAPNVYLKELQSNTVSKLRKIIRSHVSRMCLCWTLGYPDFCSTSMSLAQLASVNGSDSLYRGGNTLDVLVEEWGVGDD